MGLEEIVVTANKRAESVQRVPIAITAVTGDQLAAAGIQSTAELAAMVPGLTLENSQNGLEPHLRGVGTTAISAGEENSIATYVDGVYFANLSGSLMQLNSISQVEVDKGPQGTLFGRNATGGVIDIKTKDPVQTFSGVSNLSYGNYNTISTQDYVTGGIAQNLATDLAFYYSDQAEGYGRNLFNGREVNKTSDIAVRNKWLWTPTDRDQFRLAMDYEHTDSTAPVALHPVPGHPTNWGPGPGPFGQPYLYTGGPWDVDMYDQPVYRFQQGGISLDAQHGFDFAQLTNIFAYRRGDKYLFWDVELIPTSAEAAGWDEFSHQVSEEIRLSANPDSKIKWVLGYYYLDATVGYDPFNIQGTVAVPAPLQEITFLANERTRSNAAFGQASTPIPGLGHTNLTMGLRYTREVRSLTGSTVLTFVPPIPSLDTGLTDAQKTFDKLTWRLTLDHQFTPDTLGYISYNRGFKSGLYNTIPPGGPTATPVEPEVLDAYEIGVKSELDSRVRFNASGFYYKYSQLQVTVYTPTAAVLENAAKAQIYGVDVDMEARVTNHFSLTAGAEILRDKFVSFPDAQFLIPQSIAQGGGDNPVLGDAAGNQLPYTPRYAFSMSGRYVVPIASGNLDLSLTYAYTSNWYAGPDNILRSPISNLLNAQAGWTLPDGRSRVGIWVKNLTNQAVPGFLSANNNPGGRDQETMQPPRTYGISAKYVF
jgi:iron complex outermembrane receptor protein